MTTMDIQRLDASSIEQYLRSHPEFFLSRNDLLMELAVPHSTGGAVSLVERQVALLREQNRRYRRQLQNLMQIARTNDELIARLQKLSLELLCLPELERVLATIEQSLKDDFQADKATLHLFDGPPEAGAHKGFLDVTIGGTMDEQLQRLLAGGKPLCGKLGAQQLTSLFGSDVGAAVGSTAVLPLRLPDAIGGHPSAMFGMLAIGSTDETRFNADMDTHYLVHMSQLIACKLSACRAA